MLMSAALERDMVPEAGIPLAWYEVLLHLSRAEGSMMRYQDLARCAGISDSGASRRLEQMIRSGLIERKLCASDRRGVFAHVTVKGQAAFKRAQKVFLDSLERNFGASFETEEAEVVSAALSKIPLG